MVNLAPAREADSAAATKPAMTVTALILRFLAARLKEGSTVRGVLLLATACGLYIDPEKQEAIVMIGLALAGAIGVIYPDVDQ